MHPRSTSPTNEPTATATPSLTQFIRQLRAHSKNHPLMREVLTAVATHSVGDAVMICKTTRCSKSVLLDVFRSEAVRATHEQFFNNVGIYIESIYDGWKRSGFDTHAPELKALSTTLKAQAIKKTQKHVTRTLLHRWTQSMQRSLRSEDYFQAHQPNARIYTHAAKRFSRVFTVLLRLEFGYRLENFPKISIGNKKDSFTKGIFDALYSSYITRV